MGHKTGTDLHPLGLRQSKSWERNTETWLKLDSEIFFLPKSLGETQRFHRFGFDCVWYSFFCFCCRIDHWTSLGIQEVFLRDAVYRKKSTLATMCLLCTSCCTHCWMTLELCTYFSQRVTKCHGSYRYILVVKNGQKVVNLDILWWEWKLTLSFSLFATVTQVKKQALLWQWCTITYKGLHSERTCSSVDSFLLKHMVRHKAALCPRWWWE